MVGLAGYPFADRVSCPCFTGNRLDGLIASVRSYRGSAFSWVGALLVVTTEERNERPGQASFEESR